MTIFVRSLMVLLFGGALVLGSGCAPTSYELTPSQQTPAATGEVKVEEDDNNNLRLDLQVNHLPPPSNVAAGMSTYVVWLEPTGRDRLINLGALQINDERQGTLEATTPYQSFNLFVTAENSPQVEEPSEHLILRRQIDHES